MTAIVILVILAFIGVIIATSVVGYLKQFKVKDLGNENYLLKKDLGKHQDLIRSIRDSSYDYGYPADPLASIIVGAIRDFEKENSK